MRAEIPLRGDQNERTGGDCEIKSSQQTRCRSHRGNGVVDKLAIFGFFRPLRELLLDGSQSHASIFRVYLLKNEKTEEGCRATRGEDDRSRKVVRQDKSDGRCQAIEEPMRRYSEAHRQATNMQRTDFRHGHPCDWAHADGKESDEDE